MTVILAFMAVAIALSLFVAHLASAVVSHFTGNRLEDNHGINSSDEILDRLSRDQRYSKLL